jgi:hypothetical protein
MNGCGSYSRRATRTPSFWSTSLKKTIDVMTALGTTDLDGWTGDWLGAPTFFSSYPPEINVA